MSAAPTPYEPQYNFTQFQTANPNTPLPAVQVDNELANIATSVDETINRLGQIQNSDGTVANNSVGPNQLTGPALTLLSSGVWTYKGQWTTLTAYVPTNLVYELGNLYFCIVAHTSGTFATDLASGDWVVMTPQTPTIGGNTISANLTGSPAFPTGNTFIAIDNALDIARVDVASSATTAIGGAASPYVRITGTTTITAFDNVAAGIVRKVLFGSALTLTYNATSLIIPTSANIIVMPGDTAFFVSEGSQNWRCLVYQTATGAALVGSSSGGSGNGFTNWVTNGMAQSGTTGWAVYNNSSGSVPTTGTGGVVTNLTLGTTTTNPQSGTNSFQIVKSAANIQGEGVSYDFTVDRSNLARIQQISLVLEVITGSMALGDVTLWIYDKTNGVLIQPVAYQFPSAVVGTNPIEYTISATFQTNITSSSYRLIMHYASTNANALTFNFDNVMVGPQLISYGSAETDWTSYTPTTQGLGTISSATFYWRRVGDSAHIRGDFTTGTVAASLAQVSVPSGLLIDPSKITGNSVVGPVSRGGSATLTSVIAAPSTSFLSFGTGSTLLTPGNGSAVFGSTEAESFDAVVPILGWSSAVRMSQPDQTRTVNFEVNGTPTGTLTNSYHLVTFPVVVKDTHAGYSAGVYTIPVQGTYHFDSAFITSGTVAANGSTDIAIYQNGSLVKANQVSFSGTDTAAITSSIAASFDCLAGDTIQIQTQTSGTLTFGSTAGFNYFSGYRVAGPERIAASEVVSAKYYQSSNQTNSGSVQINYDTKVFDSHGSVTTTTAGSSGTWKFTAPRAATYQLNSLTTYSATTNVILYKNGSIEEFGAFTTSGADPQTWGTLLQLNAGDFIDIRPAASGTSFGNPLIGPSSNICTISIFSIT